VVPPEQFWVVPDRIRWASRTSPSLPKRSADAPPSKLSEFDTSTKPPAESGNVAIPSEARCQENSVPGTISRPRATMRERKHGASRKPF
jgi:hypothetical protein